MKHFAGVTHSVGILKHCLGALLPEYTIHFLLLFNIVNVLFKMTDKVDIPEAINVFLRDTK